MSLAPILDESESDSADRMLRYVNDSNAGSTSVLPKHVKHSKGSDVVLDKARMKRCLNIANEKNITLKKANAELQATQSRLIAVTPHAQSITGKRARRILTKKKKIEVSDADCETLIHVAFGSLSGCVGVNLDRLHTFMADLIKENTLQHALRVLVVLTEAKLANPDHMIVFVVSCQFDSTLQPMSGVQHRLLGRIDMTALAEVMVTSGSFDIHFCPAGTDEVIVASDFSERMNTMQIISSHMLNLIVH